MVSPGFPSPVSPTVAPYSPSVRPTPLPWTALCGCGHGWSPVDPAFDQQCPHHAGQLVGQGHSDQYLGLRASICASHEPAGAPRELAQRTTALAPRISNRRSVRSPRLEMAPSFCLPPVDFCNGVSPSQAAKSRPVRNPSGAGTRAGIAVAALGPMPGYRVRLGAPPDLSVEFA